jgi:CheY-like chemotaxis protein
LFALNVYSDRRGRIFLISEYLRAILEGGGHWVIATFEADEAIEVLERVRDIQLVITDVDMPGSMDGLRLAAAIRDRWPPIHLMVVTGLATTPRRHVQPARAQAHESTAICLIFQGYGYERRD